MTPRVPHCTAASRVRDPEQEPAVLTQLQRSPVCTDRSDVQFQFITDDSNTAACRGATCQYRFNVESGVAAYMNECVE